MDIHKLFNMIRLEFYYYLVDPKQFQWLVITII